MSDDYYASIDKTDKLSGQDSLVSGFIDKYTVLAFKSSEDRDKAKYLNSYIKKVLECFKEDLNLPNDFNNDFNSDFKNLPDSSWIGLKVNFTLKTPWYSKDDRPFHVMDNPVRKDRVFGVPFMSAASWKGMLRWACRMREGLFDHLCEHAMEMDGWKMKMDGWNDEKWILHLFGNERGKEEQNELKPGALVFYPTWFNSIGFEVINPHSREKRAGTHPIYYEVVPPETEGCLQLLYAPFPGQAERDKVRSADVMEKLIDAVESLLQVYGISAKRTAGWGAAKISGWEGFPGSGKPFEAKTPADFIKELKKLNNDQGDNK